MPGVEQRGFNMEGVEVHPRPTEEEIEDKLKMYVMLLENAQEDEEFRKEYPNAPVQKGQSFRELYGEVKVELKNFANNEGDQKKRKIDFKGWIREDFEEVIQRLEKEEEKLVS